MDSPEVMQPVPKQSVISLDEEWQHMIDKNAEDAWRKYCEINGIDPEQDDEGIITPDDCPF